MGPKGPDSSAQSGHWITTLGAEMTVTHGGGTFLSLAVKLDLRSFVKAKAPDGCLIEESAGAWPLLSDACLTDSRMTDVVLGIRFPSPNMVDVLLEKGADPMATLPGLKGTVWDNICKSTSMPWEATQYILGRTQIAAKLPSRKVRKRFMRMLGSAFKT